jgi:opacity protein-like surface antigen
MKNILLVTAAAAALYGCNQAAKNSDKAAAPAAANEVAPAAMMTANGSTPGTFEVTAKDGTKSQSILRADGTYSDMDASGKETAKGTWNVTGGKTCFDPEGNKGADCYAETPVGADGSFTATSDKGEVVTVKKVS